VQQLFRSPGNLGELLRFFRDHGREQTYGHAWHVLASQLGAWPEWLRGAALPNIYTGAIDLRGSTPLALALVVLAAVTVLAWFRDRRAFRLDALVLAAIAAGFVAVTRIVGEIFPYLVRWAWALGMLTWLAIGWSLATAWRARRDPSDARARAVGRVALGLLAAGLVVVTAVNCVDAAGAGDPATSSNTIDGLTHRILGALPHGGGVVEIAAIGGAGSTWVGAGVADDLEHHGVTTRVAPDLGFAYGPDRVVDGERVRLVVLPVEDPDLPAARARPGFEELGRVGRYTLFVKRP